MEYTPSDLRAMDESEARATLTVDQYERWEELNDLLDDAADAEDQLEAEAATVADITVHADPEALGTRVDVFGNSLLVNIDPEDPAVRESIETLESDYDASADVDDFDDAEADQLASDLLALLDAALVKWEDTDWADLPDAERQRVLEDARAKWGLSGLSTAWAEISAAVGEDREAKVSKAEKFRDPERRGDR